VEKPVDASVLTPRDSLPGFDPSSNGRGRRNGNYTHSIRPRASSVGVAPETPVLMADITWRPASAIKRGDTVIGFDEIPNPGRYRRLRIATIEAVMVRRANTITLTTAFGEVRCTRDLLFLEKNRFRKAARLTGLRLASKPVEPPVFDYSYKIGYLRGAMAGDGSISRGPGQIRASLRVCDAPFASRFARFGRDLGFDGFREFTYSMGYKMRPLYGVRTSRVKEVSLLDPYSELRPTAEYMRGWLAGAFDAEGSNGGGTMLRVHQRISNRRFWDTAQCFLSTLGLPYAVEKNRPSKDVRRERMGALRIGKLADQLRFIAMTQPMLQRKWAYLRQGGLKGTTEVPVISKLELGIRLVLSIQTSTRTLIGGGFLLHGGYETPGSITFAGLPGPVP
jgi:hypothetical protein